MPFDPTLNKHPTSYEQQSALEVPDKIHCAVSE